MLQHPDDSVATAESQEVLNSPTLGVDIAFINASLSCLPEFIEKLPENKVDILNEFQDTLYTLFQGRKEGFSATK